MAEGNDPLEKYDGGEEGRHRQEHVDKGRQASDVELGHIQLGFIFVHPSWCWDLQLRFFAKHKGWQIMGLSLKKCHFQPQTQIQELSI